jgi:hypothetical protein
MEKDFSLNKSNKTYVVEEKFSNRKRCKMCYNKAGKLVSKRFAACRKSNCICRFLCSLKNVLFKLHSKPSYYLSIYNFFNTVSDGKVSNWVGCIYYIDVLFIFPVDGSEISVYRY